MRNVIQGIAVVVMLLGCCMADGDAESLGFKIIVCCVGVIALTFLVGDQYEA